MSCFRWVRISTAIVFVAPVAFAGPVEDAVAARCTVDPRLSRAAAAALAPADHLDVSALRTLAEHDGLAAPAVHAVVIRGINDTARAAAVSRWLDARNVTPASRCAMASHGDLVAVALVPRCAEVRPLDPTAAPGATRSYVFGLPPGGVTDPVLVVALPAGAVESIPVIADGPTRVRFRDPGDYALQLVVTTDGGPAPVATWHVSVGDSHANAPRARAVHAPWDVLAAVNAMRVRAGLPALRADPLLAQVAGRYASRLAARAEVVHEPSPGDSPVARLAAAHIIADRVAENVARAPTLALAHARLLASPSHRANLLDPVVDTLGIGIASSGEDVYLVELLAAHPGLRGDIP